MLCSPRFQRCIIESYVHFFHSKCIGWLVSVSLRSSLFLSLCLRWDSYLNSHSFFPFVLRIDELNSVVYYAFILCVYIFLFWMILILFGSCSFSSLSYPLILCRSRILYGHSSRREKQKIRLKSENEMEREKEHISVSYFIFPHSSVSSQRIKWRKTKQHYSSVQHTLCFFLSVFFFSSFLSFLEIVHIHA